MRPETGSGSSWVAWLEQGKSRHLDRMAFVNRSDEVAGQRADHGITLLLPIKRRYNSAGPSIPTIRQAPAPVGSRQTTVPG